MSKRKDGGQLPYELRDIADTTVTLPAGVTVRVKTIYETVGPFKMSGFCTCHQEGAQHGTAIFWPADGRPQELFQYGSEEGALQGHADTVSALLAGELVVEDGRVLLTVTARCGHDQRVVLPRLLGASIELRRVAAAQFDDCSSCRLSVEAVAVVAEGCER